MAPSDVVGSAPDEWFGRGRGRVGVVPVAYTPFPHARLMPRSLTVTTSKPRSTSASGLEYVFLRDALHVDVLSDLRAAMVLLRAQE